MDQVVLSHDVQPLQLAKNYWEARDRSFRGGFSEPAH